MLDNVYRSENRFLQHLQTQNENITVYQAEVGATAGDIASIGSDTDNMEFLMELCNLADDFKKTTFGIKAEFYSSAEEVPAGAFAPAPATVPPSPIMAGAIRRSRERDQRFLHATNISQAAKIALDLVGEVPAPLTPEEIKPSIEVFAAQTGYVFSVVTSDRADSDSWTVSVQPKDGDWSQAGTFTGKSADVTYSPGTPGQPVLLNVRVQLKKKNTNYGQLSDIVQVTVNP